MLKEHPEIRGYYSYYQQQSSIWPDWNFFFFNCYLAVSRPTFDHFQGDSLTNPMLITVFVQVRPEGHGECHNEVGSLNPVEHLAGFEPGTFQFWLQRLNPLGHSPSFADKAKIEMYLCFDWSNNCGEFLCRELVKSILTLLKRNILPGKL